MKNHIKEFRESAGMTQRELGAGIGLQSKNPQEVISNYETEIRSPGLHTCRRIVLALSKAGATMDSVFPVELRETA